MLSTDVLVLGGGPAGYAAAIALAQVGGSVLLLDHEPPLLRRGEMLSPGAATELKKLGCWEAFCRGAHIPCPGIISSWGDPCPHEADFITNPFGMGWFVVGSGLREMFSSRLRACGGEVLELHQRVAPKRLAPGRWQVDLGRRQVEARFIVYATGRAPLPGVQSGKITVDKQVALLRTGSRSAAHGDQDMRLQVEAQERGWWYLALCPGGHVVQAFLTDADLLPKRAADKQAWLEAAPRRAPHIAERLDNCSFSTTPKVVSATTFLRKRVAGADWLAVGDAAMGTDPLSGQGITRAMRSGVMAAEAIVARERSPTALRDYAVDTLTSFRRFVRSRAAAYQREQRWPQSTYWSRRATTTFTSTHSSHR